MESNQPNQTALAQARSLFTKFNAMATPPNIYQVGGQGSQPGDNSYFPSRIGSTDPDDQKYMLRQQLVSNGQVPGVGTAIVGDEFFDYAKRKQDQALDYDFTTWVQKQANLTTPEAAAWWFDKFPWLKDLKLQEINREAEVQKRLATISITGPQSQEDFMVLFMKNQGLLKPANVPLYQLGVAGAGGVAQQGGFIKGVFNPFTPAYPQSMENSIVSFSNPVNSGMSGLPQLSPSTPAGVGYGPAAGTPTFNINSLLTSGGVFG